VASVRLWVCGLIRQVIVYKRPKFSDVSLNSFPTDMFVSSCVFHQRGSVN